MKADSEQYLEGKQERWLKKSLSSRVGGRDAKAHMKFMFVCCIYTLPFLKLKTQLMAAYKDKITEYKN